VRLPCQKDFIMYGQVCACVRSRGWACVCVFSPLPLFPFLPFNSSSCSPSSDFTAAAVAARGFHFKLVKMSTWHRFLGPGSNEKRFAAKTENEEKLPLSPHLWVFQLTSRSWIALGGTKCTCLGHHTPNKWVFEIKSWLAIDPCNLMKLNMEF